MSEEKYWCKLTQKNCDKTCELWDDCPIEKHDIADGKFINEVIEYAQRKKK